MSKNRSLLISKVQEIVPALETKQLLELYEKYSRCFDDVTKELPKECKFLILSFLDNPLDVVRLTKVNRTWRNLTKSIPQNDKYYQTMSNSRMGRGTLEKFNYRNLTIVYQEYHARENIVGKKCGWFNIYLFVLWLRIFKNGCVFPGNTLGTGNGPAWRTMMLQDYFCAHQMWFYDIKIAQNYKNQNSNKKPRYVYYTTQYFHSYFGIPTRFCMTKERWHKLFYEYIEKNTKKTRNWNDKIKIMLIENESNKKIFGKVRHSTNRNLLSYDSPDGLCLKMENLFLEKVSNTPHVIRARLLMLHS